MPTSDTNRIIKTTIYLCIFISLAILFVTSSLGIESPSRWIVSLCPTITIAFWWFYFKIGWKLSPLNKILYKTDLNGTWFGTYKSKYNCKCKPNEEYTGNIALVIEQNYLSIKIQSLTENYTSDSYLEKLNQEAHNHKLVYLYSQDGCDDTPFDSTIRKGISEFLLKKTMENKSLKGSSGPTPIRLD